MAPLPPPRWLNWLLEQFYKPHVFAGIVTLVSYVFFLWGSDDSVLSALSAVILGIFAGILWRQFNE